MLAEWNIPPTDPRLRGMNTARWVLAHQMQIEKDRREVRKWARFVGTDLSAYSDTPDDEDKPIRAIPLAAVLNPEAHSKLANTYSMGEESFIEDSEYEKQAEILEKGGLLTEIDSIVGEAEIKAKDKKEKTEKDRTQKTLDNDLSFLKQVDELTNKAEQMVHKRRRPRIVR